MTITTFSFSKDKKSTKIPTSGGTQHNIVLKENTSVDNPTFILTHDGVPTFDYCQWIFGYYFVEDIKLQSKDVYEVNCKLDVLATYRNDILSSTQFVVRSASDYNVYLNDEKMHNGLLETKTVSSQVIDKLNGSSYIIRVLGLTNRDTQLQFDYGIPTYVISENDIRKIVAAGFDNRFLTVQAAIDSIEDVGELLKCIFMNPSEYILSINWLPVNIQTSNTHNVYLGWIDSTVSGGILDTDGTTWAYGFATPTKYFNDFRDYDTNYTRFELSLPGVGVVQLNNSDVYQGLGLQLWVEYLTGTLIYILSINNNSAVVGKYTTKISASIEIGGVTHSGTHPQSMISALSSILTGVTNPSYSTIGTVESKKGILVDHTLRLTRRIYNTHSYGTSRVGRPLHEMRTLSNLSGFCQCENAKLDTTAYGIIKDEIIDYMNEGFIIE